MTLILQMAAGTFNQEALNFFLLAGEDSRQRTEFYNGTHHDWKKCADLEVKMRKYMNQKLAQMRQQGWKNVPADIPERKKKS